MNFPLAVVTAVLGASECVEASRENSHMPGLSLSKQEEWKYISVQNIFLEGGNVNSRAYGFSLFRLYLIFVK